MITQGFRDVGDRIDVAQVQLATTEVSTAQFSDPTSCAANCAFFSLCRPLQNAERFYGGAQKGVAKVRDRDGELETCWTEPPACPLLSFN